MLKAGLYTVFLTMGGVALTSYAAPVVSNGDFETNASAFGTYPGYVGGSNPAAIPGWTGAGSLGVNPGDGSYGAPFRDNGNDSTNVGFIQVNGTNATNNVSQSIGGFTSNATYVLTLNYNARNCCGSNPNLNVNIGSANTQIDNIQPVGGSNPYYQVSVPFTASSGTQSLTVTASNPSSDATALLDNFSIQQVKEIAINNPSFEANTHPWPGTGPINGWNGGSGINPSTGSPGCCGQSPFTPGRGGPNASAPDGNQVAYIQEAGTMDQLIGGLTIGTVYTLTFFDGHRNGDSGAGDTLTASMGGVALGTDTPNVNDYTPHTYTFIATATSEDLAFTHGNITGDQSVAIDDVSIFTAVPEPASLSLLGFGAVGLLVCRRRL